MAAVKTDMESMQYQQQYQATQLQGGCSPHVAVAITEPDIQQIESGVSSVQLQSGHLLPLSTVRTESMPFDGMSAVAVTKTETLTLHNSGTVQARGDIIPFQFSVQNYRSALACVSETAQTSCDLESESSNVKSCVQDLAVPVGSNHALTKYTTPLLPHEQESRKMTMQQQMTESQQHTSYPSQVLFQHCVPQQPQHDVLTQQPQFQYQQVMLIQQVHQQPLSTMDNSDTPVIDKTEQCAGDEEDVCGEHVKESNDPSDKMMSGEFDLSGKELHNQLETMPDWRERTELSDESDYSGELLHDHINTMSISRQCSDGSLHDHTMSVSIVRELSEVSNASGEEDESLRKINRLHDDDVYQRLSTLEKHIGMIKADMQTIMKKMNAHESDHLPLRSLDHLEY